MWPLYALTLSVATLFPSLANAQAPSGVARVDSDTYFDTSNASWGYHNHQDNLSPYPDESGSSWFDQGHLSSGNGSSDHAGLLGKMYVRGAYISNGINDTTATDFDSPLDGWQIEFNAPIPWISSDVIGSDFFVYHDHRSVSATNRSPAFRFRRKGDFTVVGGRLFAIPESRVRPYIALGAGFSTITTSAGSVSVDEDDDGFVTVVGIEVDLATNAAVRVDFEIDREDIDDSTFEGLVILWLNENVFFRGGILAPLSDGFDPGATVGGGLAF
jgi:hypothetical protein